jgi:hypothetical protein
LAQVDVQLVAADNDGECHDKGYHGAHHALSLTKSGAHFISIKTLACSNAKIYKYPRWTTATQRLA